MLGAEILGETCAIEDVAMFESLHQLLVAANYRSEVRQQYDTHQQGHCLFIEVFPCPVADKQQLGFGMVDDVVDIVGLELMQNGNNDSSIGNRRQKSDCPMCTVTSANGNLVTGPDAGAFQYDMEFGYFPCYIFVLQCNSFVVCQGVAIPVFNNALFYIIDEPLFLFHSAVAHFS